MAKFFRKFTKRFFIFSHIAVVVVFLVACLAAYCHPVTYWYVAVLGVGLILLAIGVLFFFFFWLTFRSKWALLSVAALVAGWFQVQALFGFNAFTTYTPYKKPGSFRVLSWNVSRWDEMNKRKKGGSSNRLSMFEYIRNQDADILCVQEFFESMNPALFEENIPYITEKLNYPYYFFSRDHITGIRAYEHGVAIFSRFPIIDTFRLKYPGRDSIRGSESLIRATIDLHGQKINVFTTHLQSFLFTNTDYRSIQHIKKVDDTDSVMEASKSIISKFRRSYLLRSSQAEIVRSKLDSSIYPEIISGDFNDVPNSYTYFTIRGNRQDAFIKKGFGLGRTFVFISPTLRIDYVLADKAFKVLQYHRTKLPYSDHFPIIADFELPTPEK
jgi:endonuclease/exonuclease/phosphatase family metal-dependent hydrolase